MQPREEPPALPSETAAGADRPPPRRFTLPLKPTVLAVFALMTVPVLLGIVRINYVSSDRVAREYAANLLERFRREAIRDIESNFAALSSLIATAAELGRQDPAVFQDDRALPYLFRILQHSDTVLNVYVGLEDGSFRQARRLHDRGIAIHGTPPPPDAAFAYRLVEPGRGTPVLDRYIFLDSRQNRLGEVAAASGYDPRQRPWYERTAAAGVTTITDPEVFYAFGLVGITVAAPFALDGRPLGVVAADITLDSFAAYLASHRISEGSVSYLLDQDGMVLAASDGSAAASSKNDQVRLHHVSAVETGLAALAYGSRPRGERTPVYGFSHEGRDYVASLSGFDESFGKEWQLFVVTPLDDFTGQFSSHNRRMLMLGLVAVAAQLLIIYVLASLITSPLQKLALKVDRINRLEPSRLPPLTSRIREVALLSRAIETLDSAIKAFASFVPVGLVRQLLQTEQKLELGGQSRFLTIFFSDVEGFSTMAETMPSRELLARMSTLLELISKMVHEEAGTIDKFVGDGVMAFWGAPALLEDHARHACVAALRIQLALDELNRQWREAGEPEMRVRMGIHSDAVLVGNVGSQQRMSYTVIGDGVNIASRLEGINKTYGTRICISHDTFREAGDRLCVRPIDEVAVKGRRARIAIYELLGAYGLGGELEPTPAAEHLARLTRQAFAALVAGDHAAALAHYREILDLAPGDRIAELHVHRLNAAHEHRRGDA